MASRQRKPATCSRCAAPLIVSPALGRLCPTPTSANTFCFSHVRASRARGCGTSASTFSPHPPPAPPGSAAAARRTQPSKTRCCFPTGTEMSSHQSRLLQQLDQQRKADLFCDCSIHVGRTVFKAHRNVLSASSGYFKTLLLQGSKQTSQPTTATLEVFSAETFKVILDFMYSGKLALTGENVTPVMSAASYLQMTDILNICKTFVKSSLDISVTEKDRYLSLLAQSTNGERAHPPPYHLRNKAKRNLRCCSPIQDKKTDSRPMPHKKTAAGKKNSLTSVGSSGVTLPQAVTQPPEKGRKTGSPRPCRKPLGPSQTADVVLRQSNKAKPAGRGGGVSEPSHIAGLREEAEAEVKKDAAGDGYGKSHKSEVTPGTWSVAQLKELSRTPDLMTLKAEQLYISMPTILGVMSSSNEENLYGYVKTKPITRRADYFPDLLDYDDSPLIGFKCPFCTRTVKRRIELKRHLRCHTGERPYPCKTCGRRFTRSEHLQNHLRNIHQENKMKCRECKCHVTDLTGCVIQQGAKRYRLCYKCLQESNFDSKPDKTGAKHPPASCKRKKPCKRALEKDEKWEGGTVEEEPCNLDAQHKGGAAEGAVNKPPQVLLSSALLSIHSPPSLDLYSGLNFPGKEKTSGILPAEAPIYESKLTAAASSEITVSSEEHTERNNAQSGCGAGGPRGFAFPAVRRDGCKISLNSRLSYAETTKRTRPFHFTGTLT
ncbi:LOW QUALITY PROTEIN: zinc finger and BTB domain-containing protein 8A-like [Rhynochetos jubatus]